MQHWEARRMISTSRSRRAGTDVLVMVDLKAHERGFESNLHRFQTCEIYRSSQTNIGWTEEVCKLLDDLAQEDHSCVATRQE